MRTIKDPTYNTYRGGGNVEKPVAAKDDKSLKADLEKRLFDVERNLIDTITEDFEKNGKPGEDIFEYLDRMPDEYFKRITLSDGGKVIDFLQYAKSKKVKPKEINLAQGDFEKTVASLTDADKSIIKDLLRRSGIKVSD